MNLTPQCLRDATGSRPSIVITIRFEGINRDPVTGKLSLRDPKLLALRSGRATAEADIMATIEELYLRQHVA